ncbi:hypothetical protein SNEBB_007438 [Seison nebaliae]|nr:hypothetical protein SNEBB_007438 [Seison nebaliae]
MNKRDWFDMLKRTEEEIAEKKFFRLVFQLMKERLVFDHSDSLCLKRCLAELNWSQMEENDRPFFVIMMATALRKDRNLVNELYGEFEKNLFGEIIVTWLEDVQPFVSTDEKVGGVLQKLLMDHTVSNSWKDRAIELYPFSFDNELLHSLITSDNLEMALHLTLKQLRDINLTRTLVTRLDETMKICEKLFDMVKLQVTNRPLFQQLIHSCSNICLFYTKIMKKIFCKKYRICTNPNLDNTLELIERITLDMEDLFERLEKFLGFISSVMFVDINLIDTFKIIFFAFPHKNGKFVHLFLKVISNFLNCSDYKPSEECGISDCPMTVFAFGPQLCVDDKEKLLSEILEKVKTLTFTSEVHDRIMESWIMFPDVRESIIYILIVNHNYCDKELNIKELLSKLVFNDDPHMITFFMKHYRVNKFTPKYYFEDVIKMVSDGIIDLVSDISIPRFLATYLSHKNIIDIRPDLLIFLNGLLPVPGNQMTIEHNFILIFLQHMTKNFLSTRKLITNFNELGINYQKHHEGYFIYWKLANGCLLVNSQNFDNGNMDYLTCFVKECVPVIHKLSGYDLFRLLRSQKDIWTLIGQSFGQEPTPIIPMENELKKREDIKQLVDLFEIFAFAKNFFKPQFSATYTEQIKWLMKNVRIKSNILYIYFIYYLIFNCRLNETDFNSCKENALISQDPTEDIVIDIANLMDSLSVQSDELNQHNRFALENWLKRFYINSLKLLSYERVNRAPT